MIDTHSHLFDEAFHSDLEGCIQRCKLNHVNKVILVGFSRSTNGQAFELSQKFPMFYPTAGLHPSEAGQDFLNDLEELESFITTHKVYAIGECGLDYHYGKDNLLEQKELFKGQILLSIKYDLPLIIHMRDATQDCYEMLAPYKGKIKGVMHCYSGSLEMAYRFIDLGLLISIGGPVTFKNAKESKRIAAELDLKYLLVETDCPYLAPVPYRGSRNESSYVHLVVEEIAHLKNIPSKEVENRTEQNAVELFGLEEIQI